MTVCVSPFQRNTAVFFAVLLVVAMISRTVGPEAVAVETARGLVDPSSSTTPLARAIGEPSAFGSSAPPDVLAFVHDSEWSPYPYAAPAETAGAQTTGSTRDVTSASPATPPTTSGNSPTEPAPRTSALAESEQVTAVASGRRTNTTTSTTPSRAASVPATNPSPTTIAAPVTTVAPTTTAAPAPTPASRPPNTRGRAGYIAPSAPTYIPVYDTAWQMLVRSTPGQADNYFAALKANGFSGTWTGIIHHAPATYNLNFAGGGQVGSMQNGELVLSSEYIEHVRQILDAADRHGMKVGLVAAWQNLYLPGGGADRGVATSDAVRGTITTANAHSYGAQIATAFGGHPAVSMWVFGGDAGTNNTNANKAVWREMARGVRDAGNTLSITYHTPTSEFDQLNYAGEPWLDFIAPETGHAQDAATTETELRNVRSVYGLPVWQGEPRYFNINFNWVNAAFRNPGVNEVRSDAQAAESAGVSGYVYGDAGRWTWCAGFGDSTPCSASNVAASFGAGEQAVIDVFSSP